MEKVTFFLEAQATQAELEAASLLVDIHRYEAVIDDWDMYDESVEAHYHLRYLDRRLAALVRDYEAVTGRKYERGPQ